MRIARLQMIKYGRFPDQSMEFPSPATEAAPDFHLVCGHNEKGKSTTRRALGDFLFGVPTQTDMALLDSRPEIRLHATVESANGQMALVRGTSRNDSLRTDQGDVVSNAKWQEWIGALTRDDYERLFSLDRSDLEKGALALMKAEGDLGSQLFASAAGISTLASLRRDIAERHGKLVVIPTRRRSNSLVINNALSKWADAKHRQNESMLRDSVRKDAERELNEAEQAHDSIIARAAQVKSTASRLSRVSRCHNQVLRLREIDGELEKLADAPELPADASQQIADATTKKRQSEGTAEIHRQDAAEKKDSAENIVVDKKVLQNERQIIELQSTASRFSDNESDIAARRAERNQLLQSVKEALLRAGRRGKAAEAIDDNIPNAELLSTLSELRSQHGANQTAVTAAQRALTRADTDLERAKSSAAKSAEAVPAAIRAAVKQAQAALTRHPDRERAREAHSVAVTLRESRLTALAPWAGTAENLAKMNLPEIAAVSSRLEDQRGWARQIHELRQSIMTLDSRREAATESIARLRADETIATDADVNLARGERNQTWTQIVDDGDIASRRTEYERLVKDADRLADLRHSAAARAAELVQAERDRDDTARESRLASTKVEQLQADIDKQQTAWAERKEQLGVPGLTIEQFSDWRQKRTDALAAIDDEKTKAVALARETGGLDKAITGLKSACEGSAFAIDEDLATESHLEQVLLTLASAIKADDVAQTAADTRQQRLQECRDSCEQCKEELQTAEAELAEWKTAWLQAMKDAGLPRELPPDGAMEALAALQRALRDFEGARILLTERIEPMVEQLQNLTRAAASLAPLLADAGAELSTAEMSDQLVQKLADTKEQNRLQTTLLEESEELMQRSVASKRDAETATETLQALFNAADVEDLDALNRQVERSDERREKQKERDEVEEQVLRAGDSLPIDQILVEVHDVLENISVDELAAHVTKAEDDLSLLTAERDDAVTRRTEAAAAVNAFGSGDEAAQAATDMQAQSAIIADAGEEYLRLRIRELALQRGIERFRETHQGPMLNRSSELFVQLTVGNFDRLSVDPDANPPILEAIRSSLPSTDHTGMSDGTQDQMYLALRLAALEQHVAQTRPLPFIADDLFINFDDTRSEAGFAALGELARKTQVIYFTHHDHLVPIARKALGDINVIEL